LIILLFINLLTRLFGINSFVILTI